MKARRSFGANAIGTGYEYRFLIFAGIQRKQAAEAAQIAQYLRTIGCLDVVFDQLDGAAPVPASITTPESL